LRLRAGEARCGDIMQMRGALICLIFVVVFCGVALIAVDRPNNASMDFIERYFGFSPDGGDGSTEILILVALSLAVGAIGLSMRSPVK